MIVAEPGLASLRNAKNMYDLLKQNRPNDKLPRVVLNQVGIPKRPEISTPEFAKALGVELTGVIPFDGFLFGSAANNGQMIGEIQPGSKIVETMLDMAGLILGRTEPKRVRSNFLKPLKDKLIRLKAS